MRVFGKCLFLLSFVIQFSSLTIAQTDKQGSQDHPLVSR